MLYRLDEVSKSFGPQEILRDVSWQHNPGERIGLVGRNGAGKTTLFRLIARIEEPDHGSIISASALRVGYLRQHIEVDSGTSLFDYVLAAFEDVLELEERMREIEHRLADPGEPDHDALLEKYSKIQHDYEHADGYRIHSEVERVLSGIGFAEEQWEKSVDELSGGQQNRAMLARLLLSRVDVLLLDEPTNHLDLNGIEFLEEFLSSFSGSYLLISHDRTFLNRTVDKIVELAHGGLYEYPGDYDKFIRLRAERHELMRKAWEEQQELIDKTKDFIRRNIAGQKTKQAQSRRKMLEKMETVDRPQTDETLAVFRLDAGPRSGAVAVSLEQASVGYSEPVVTDVNLVIRRGERHAIMGPNGSGKSTLLKSIAGRLELLAGRMTHGHNVQIGYYDQGLGDLDSSMRVIDEIWDIDHSKSEEDVRNFLARYSFFGEDVFKSVGALSGGEKGRLALARIMYTGGNLLLLDEPTNHLDVYTREALEEALDGFTGALVVVSHDRYFIDRVADHVILVDDGVAELHYGNYSQVRERLELEASMAEPAKRPVSSKRRIEDDRRGEDRNREKRLRRAEQEITVIEEKISRTEKACEEADLLLCDPEVYGDGERVREIRVANDRRRDDLESLYRTWEELTRQREKA